MTCGLALAACCVVGGYAQASASSPYPDACDAESRAAAGNAEAREASSQGDALLGNFETVLESLSETPEKYSPLTSEPAYATPTVRTESSGYVSCKPNASWVAAGDFADRVQSMMQVEVGMPGGCEVVSATSLMNAFWYDVSADDVGECLDTEEDGFVHSYSGSPYERGAGYPPVIAKAMNEAAKKATDGTEWSKAHEFVVADGAAFDILAMYANAGVPSLVWTTMYMGGPQFTGIYDAGYEWYANEHCVVLVGGSKEEGVVYVMDPLDGEVVEREWDAFKEIYEQCGKMCVRAKVA